MIDRPIIESDVRAIIPATTLQDLSPYISAAGSLIDRLEASQCGANLSESDLAEAQRWLSAHFAAVSDSSIAITEQKVEGSTVKVSRGANNSDGILSTQYGQMANTLSGGCLANMDLRKPQVTFV